MLEDIQKELSGLFKATPLPDDELLPNSLKTERCLYFSERTFCSDTNYICVVSG